MKSWQKAWIDFDCFFHFHFPFESVCLPVVRFCSYFHFFCNFTSFDSVVFHCFVFLLLFSFVMHHNPVDCRLKNRTSHFQWKQMALNRRIRNQARKKARNLKTVWAFSFCCLHLLPFTVLYSHMYRFGFGRDELPICFEFWMLKVNQAISLSFLRFFVVVVISNHNPLCNANVIAVYSCTLHRIIRWNTTTIKTEIRNELLQGKGIESECKMPGRLI